MSFTTKTLVGLSHALNAHGAAVAALLAALIALAIYGWRAGHAGRAFGRLVHRISPLQRQIDEFRLAKLYHSMALMFRGGYSLDDALEQCAELGLGDRMRDGVHGAKLALARGSRVSAAFSGAGLTDSVTQRLLAVGERTGNFDRVLQTIAERHAAKFATFVERATRVVEPLLLLVVALVVGGIVVAMYMPVFDMASSIR